jgi:purine catabolism regulator
VADEVARIAPKGLRAAVSAHAAGATSIVQPVGLQGRPSGYLAVLVPGRADDLDRVAVGTVVSLLGLVTESDRQRQEVLRPLRSRALELLVHADPRTAAIVLAASGDPAAALPERLVVVRARSTGGDLDEALAAAEESVPLVGRVHDELWVVSTPALVAEHAATLAGLGLLVGVGDGVRRDEAGSSHANAGHALATATPLAPVVWWERLVGEGAMGALDRERATAFAESFLAGVSEEDRILLRVFLGHHGSRLKAAEELGVHRNTVRNRMAHIESVLGRTFDDPRARVDAWVALQLTS